MVHSHHYLFLFQLYFNSGFIVSFGSHSLSSGYDFIFISQTFIQVRKISFSSLLYLLSIILVSLFISGYAEKVRNKPLKTEICLHFLTKSLNNVV